MKVRRAKRPGKPGASTLLLATLSIAVMGALWLQVFSCLDLRDGLIGPVRESRSASVASQSPRETHGVDVSLSVGSPRGKWLRVVADGALGRTDGRIYAETGTSTMNGRVPIAEAELACVAEGSSLELELDRVSLSWQWPRDGDTLLDSARRQ